MIHRILFGLIVVTSSLFGADDFPLGPDSLPQGGVAKGEMIKDSYTAKADSLFPGTQREYHIYVPAGLDKSKPVPFMVFQDGVIYQAPVVFDNLIAKKELPPLIGVFIKPGVVPAANYNALPRFNRSYEYDSVTDHYARFLIDEFLPAITAKHKLNLSADPNARAIAGNSSGGICAFMAAWHRPDQFRRVFTGVGTYVGIHGADQLPVLVRKYEPKPLRVYLQSGEQDNDLYCGDWWMANQMMERSLTWNGYDVNHTWGKGGHNAKHATQIFPDVLRWLWKGYPNEPVKANPRSDSKWRGSEVIGDGVWEVIELPLADGKRAQKLQHLSANKAGEVFVSGVPSEPIWLHLPDGNVRMYAPKIHGAHALWGFTCDQSGLPLVCVSGGEGIVRMGQVTSAGQLSASRRCNKAVVALGSQNLTLQASLGQMADARNFFSAGDHAELQMLDKTGVATSGVFLPSAPVVRGICLSPDQMHVYLIQENVAFVTEALIRPLPAPVTDPFALVEKDHVEPGLDAPQHFGELEVANGSSVSATGLCVDTNGWLYVATSLGIQVLDQCGRVNFIIPTPKQPHDVCFGGKDLTDLFIACGDTIYKRKTKAHGYISGQMAPIKPPAPKL